MFFLDHPFDHFGLSSAGFFLGLPRCRAFPSASLERAALERCITEDVHRKPLSAEAFSPPFRKTARIHITQTDPEPTGVHELLKQQNFLLTSYNI